MIFIDLIILHFPAYVIAIPRETDRHGRITNEPNTDPIYWADLLADNFKIAKIIDGLHYM